MTPIRRTTEQYIKSAQSKHGYTYDYSATKYVTTRLKIKIICKKHGMFEQRARSHLEGRGCIECRNALSRKTKEQFIQEAIMIHGTWYDYSLVDYKNDRIKIKIICPIHGIFLQRPGVHLQQCGCVSCSHHVSNIERRWLNFIGLPDDNGYRQVSINMINKTHNVDGYNPVTNTIYEFYGDYWHGNPFIYDLSNINPTNNKSYKELYESTLQKEILIKDSGFNLITMWEYDWRQYEKSIS